MPILIWGCRNRLAVQESTRVQESTSFDNDCKFTYSFTAHMHEIPKYFDWLKILSLNFHWIFTESVKIFWYFMHMRGKTVCEFTVIIKWGRFLHPSRFLHRESIPAPSDQNCHFGPLTAQTLMVPSIQYMYLFLDVLLGYSTYWMGGENKPQIPRYPGS